VLHNSHVGEALSLIYAPFYFDNRVVDGVLNQPVSGRLPDDFDPSSLEGGAPDWPTGFLPTLCPDCGWDLTGQGDSLALLCTNCNTVWNPGRKRLESIPFARADGGDEGALFLPFWRIQAEVEGISLRSYADLVQAANLPRVVQPGWEEKAFRFWSPAFKIRPSVFLTLCRNLTLSQPEGEVADRLPGRRLHPVNLPVREAVECLKTTLASFVKPPGKMLPLLPDISVKAKRYLLVWVPFTEGPHEYLRPEAALAVNKNLLHLSGNL
jgi:hypothetical protein